MKSTRLLLTAFLICLASLPALAQVNDTYIIPAAANANGAFGTRWMTQFSLFNPQLDHDLVVSVTFVPTGGATGIEELVEVPANSLAFSDNILEDLFDIRNGSGALLVATFPEDNPGVPNSILARSFLVTSNTYNDSREGTYGSTIPGVWAGLFDYDTDDISAVSQNIRSDSWNGWRTNIGAVNLGRCSVTLRVSVYDFEGRTVVNRAPFVIPPLAHFQDRLPIEIEAASVEFFVDDPCSTSADNYAVVFPYTTTIDVLSGDPKYQSPTLLASANVLFSQNKNKSNRAQARIIDPTQLGRKIDTKYARGVRAQAEHRGTATLTRELKGFRITR